MRTKQLLFVVLTASTIAAGCGSDGGGGQPGPCESASPPPECEVSCSADTECGAGFYCGADGQCTADCTAGGGECPAGQGCDDDGRCVPGGGDADAGDDCPDIAVALDPVIPTVWLLIDQSGSMTQGFGGGSRWEAVVAALVDATNGVVKQLEDRVVFGASLYTSNGGNAGGVCPILTERTPALNNYAQIDDLMRTNSPAGDTPTSESIDAVVGAFPLPDPEKPAPRLIVLATDGDPDNCVDPDAHDVGSQMMSEGSVQAAFTAGILTYVLSVGDDVTASHLQKLANAGVGQPLDTGSAPYYVANDPAQLVAAFDEIIRGARTCTFVIDCPVSVDDACSATVELNGTPLECGVDWQLIDETTLELLGDACDTFLNEDSVLLTAEFPCGVVVL